MLWGSGCPEGNPGALGGCFALEVWVSWGTLLPCGAGVQPPKQMQKHQNRLILNKSPVSSQRRWVLCVSDPDFRKFRIRFTYCAF